MNKRIQELAEQAQEYAENITPQGLEWFDAFKEKFAELLLQECVTEIHRWKNVPFPLDAKSAALIIILHFGLDGA